MNNNISEEKIEIGEKEYTLFLNRKGLITWEKTSDVHNRIKKMEQEFKTIESSKKIEIKNGVNPFEMLDGGDIDQSFEEMKDIYLVFYWIALYTHHKLDIDEVKPIFEQAIEEYGLEQLILLSNQMVEKANVDISNKNLKNLKALKPTK